MADGKYRLVASPHLSDDLELLAPDRMPENAGVDGARILRMQLSALSAAPFRRGTPRCCESPSFKGVRSQTDKCLHRSGVKNIRDYPRRLLPCLVH